MKNKLHAELIFTIVKWNCTGDFTKVLCVSSRVCFKLNCISEMKDPFQFQSIQRNTLQSMQTARYTYVLLLNAQRSEAAYSNMGVSGSCTALPTGHFRVPLCLCFKASLSGKNDFDFHEKETACRTHFHMKGFALRLVLKQRHKLLTRIWPIVYHMPRFHVSPGTKTRFHDAASFQGWVTAAMLTISLRMLLPQRPRKDF